MPESKVLRTVFVPKKEKFKRGWKEMNKLYNYKHSTNIIILAIKSKRMRWTGNLARIWDQKFTKIFGRKPKGRGRLEDLCLDCRIILSEL